MFPSVFIKQKTYLAGLPMILMPSLALPSLDVFVSGFRLGKRISLSPISAAATGTERTTNVVMLGVN